MITVRTFARAGLIVAASVVFIGGYKLATRPQGLGLLALPNRDSIVRQIHEDAEIVTGSVGPRDAAQPLPHKSAKSANLIHGTIKAGQQIMLTAEINARIARFDLREGDRFRAGDTIVAFECTRIMAEHRAAKAVLSAQSNNLASLTYLARNGAAGRHAVQQSRYETDKAREEVNALAAREALCEIRAPFDGRIAEKLAFSHEVASPNQPLVRIVDDSASEIQFLVPLRLLGQMKVGRKLDIQIDSSDEALAATIVQIAGAVDAASQTVRVAARFDRPHPGLISGISGATALRQDGD